MYKLIKKLSVVLERLKAIAIKKQERKLEVAAERVDIADELLVDTVKLHTNIYNKMLEAAANKHIKQLNKIEENRKAAAEELDKLNSI